MGISGCQLVPCLPAELPLHPMLHDLQSHCCLPQTPCRPLPAGCGAQPDADQQARRARVCAGKCRLCHGCAAANLLACRFPLLAFTPEGLHPCPSLIVPPMSAEDASHATIINAQHAASARHTQDRIEESGEEFLALLASDDALFYFCGLKRMYTSVMEVRRNRAGTPTLNVPRG